MLSVQYKYKVDGSWRISVKEATVNSNEVNVGVVECCMMWDCQGVVGVLSGVCREPCCTRLA